MTLKGIVHPLTLQNLLWFPWTTQGEILKNLHAALFHTTRVCQKQNSINKIPIKVVSATCSLYSKSFEVIQQLCHVWSVQIHFRMKLISLLIQQRARFSLNDLNFGLFLSQSFQMAFEDWEYGTFVGLSSSRKPVFFNFF